MRPTCSLTLNDGYQFEGKLIGAPLDSSGELVFTTGMVGYSEALTDPSYFGQILVFAYPLIGNYGLPSAPKAFDLPLPKGFESMKSHLSGVIVTIDSAEAFHWNSFHTLDSWLKDQNVPGIVGLDTRHLVHTIRQNPKIAGKIVSLNATGHRMLGSLNSMEGPDGFFDPGAQEIIGQVSNSEPLLLGRGKHRIGLIDYGVKWNIIRQLLEHDCEVQLIPWDSDPSQFDVSGWLLSNGPGDPTNTGKSIAWARGLIKEGTPTLGICLGHQVLSLAAGATTSKMKYGHRSHNQPIYAVGTCKGFITSQNHGYVVDDDSLPEGWEPWFKNANDQTIEGIRCVSKPLRSVQFHPESAGGPRDTGWIIDEFLDEVL